MKILFPFLILLFLLPSCGSILNNDESSHDYSIEQKKICYCDNADQWVKLYISSGRVTKAVNISTKKNLSLERNQYFKSIEDLFELISVTDTSSYILEVEMDTKNNYPTFVYLNPKPEVINDSVVVMIADADFTFYTRNYQSVD